MKKSLIILFVALVSFSTFGQNKTKLKPKLEIYYFHATNRCPTCISIENNTKKILETNFKKEVEAGTIKLIILDCDDAKNKTLVDKYGAYGSTLVFQSNVGKSEKEDLTNFAFSYSRNNPDKFKSGLKEKIEKAIK